MKKKKRLVVISGLCISYFAIELFFSLRRKKVLEYLRQNFLSTYTAEELIGSLKKKLDYIGYDLICQKSGNVTRVVDSSRDVDNTKRYRIYSIDHRNECVRVYEYVEYGGLK